MSPVKVFLDHGPTWEHVGDFPLTEIKKRSQAKFLRVGGEKKRRCPQQMQS